MTTRMTTLRNDLSDSQVSIQRALLTLRGIRQRYEMERTAHPHMRSYNLQVALGDSDMNWIDAAIEALERPIAADTR
jgi:hypothetical protein